MSLTCLAHVLHMSLTCLAHVSHMSLTCLAHVLRTHCRFTCRDGCDLADYASEEGVCEDCDALCEQCVGPGSRNCTTCRDARLGLDAR